VAVGWAIELHGVGVLNSGLSGGGGGGGGERCDVVMAWLEGRVN
jgi:hypothetical protein